MASKLFFDVEGDNIGLQPMELDDEDCKDPVRITRNIMTKYEKTAVIGARATLLAQGAQITPGVDIKGETDPTIIAELEMNAKVLPIKIRRYLPNGKYEDWDLRELDIIY